MLLGPVEAAPSLISMIYEEWYSACGFILSGSVTFAAGLALNKIFQHAAEPRYNHALVIASFVWLALTMMGSLPFYIIGQITPAAEMNGFIPSGADYTFSSLVYFKNPIHCFFESMSAYTTTGLTMTVHEPSVGKGVLFYRHFAQWVGGAGFVVMVLAIFKQPFGKKTALFYSTEIGGEKLKPRVVETARMMWKVYFIMTAFAAVYLMVGTHLILPNYPLHENIFDSINHAMAGLSTGGFSTLDDSIAGYHSPAMEMLYILPMMLGAFSLPLYYRVVFERKFGKIWRDVQTRSLIAAFAVGGAVQSALLFKAKAVPHPVREGFFQFISGMSTTGWQTSNIGAWDWKSGVFIIMGMFVGGAAGATVGGIKMTRALVILKGLRWQVNKTFLSEKAIPRIRMNGRSLLAGELNDEFARAASLAILFFMFIVGSAAITAVYIGKPFNFVDALFESASAQATVGLSSGITDPSMPPVLELLYIFQMWAGRLEIIPVLALIRAVFVGTDPKII